MKAMLSEWTTYRTRFLIRARQMDEPLTFVDCLGREHSGQAGDYLILSSDGSRRIAPREIFEDIYVPMDEPLTPQTADAVMTGASREYDTAGFGSVPFDRTQQNPRPDQQPTLSPAMRSNAAARRQASGRHVIA